MIKIEKDFWDILNKPLFEIKSNEQNNDVLVKVISNEALGDEAKEKTDTTPKEKTENENADNKSAGDNEEDKANNSLTNNEDSGDNNEENTEDALDSTDNSSTEETQMDDSSGSSDLGGNDIVPSEPGNNPFRKQNGKQLLIKQISNLESNISSTIEYLTEIPKISSVVVNGFVELRDIVHHLLETALVVPIEETLVRYTLCVKSYEFQVSNLRQTIGKIINMEEY